MAPPKFRKQIVFWLDLANDIEYEIAEYIADLKRGRAFSAAVRDGLRLIATLRRGETHILEALFPQVVRALVDSHHAEELERLRAELHNLRSGVGVTGIAESIPLRTMPDKPELPALDIPAEESGNASENLLDSFLDM